MKMWRVTAAAALLACGGSATAQAAQAARPCVTASEAEALFLAMAPDLITQAGAICATALPANALLRRPASAFVAKYRAESNGAWTNAKGALAKIAGADLQPLLESEYARPMLSGMLAPLLAANLDPADCEPVNRILTYMEPLPARNTAGLLVTILQLSQQNGKAQKAVGTPRTDLSICPAIKP